MKRAALLVLLAATLTGCAAQSAPEATATKEPTPTPTVNAALEMCEIVGEKFLDYPDYVLAISNGEFSEDMHLDYWMWGQRLRDTAPADAAQIVTDFTDPIYQVQEVVEVGGGSLTFNTDTYKQGTLDVAGYCVDAGYKLDQ